MRLDELLGLEIIQIFVDNLENCTDVEILKEIVLALGNLLELYNNQDEDDMMGGPSGMDDMSEYKNRVVGLLAQCGGFRVLEELQNHKNDDVYEVVSGIIINYIPYEGDMK